MTWEKSTKEFVVSDVIEWTETIWPPRNSCSRKKPQRISSAQGRCV